MLENETAARLLAELGQPTRLAIYRLLVEAGSEGLAVGKIGRALGVAPSTLSHHLSHLVWAGLIAQRREGRVLRCTARYETMDALIDFLRKDCCRGDAAAPRMAEGRG